MGFRRLLSCSRAVLLSGVVLFLPGACGGGGGSQVLIVALVSEQIEEGSVWSDGTVVTAGTPPFTPFAGDIDATHPGVYGRQFFSFLLAPIPAGARLESAILRLDQRQVSGSPFLSHGPLVVEHVDYGTTLDASDFDLPPLPFSGAVVLAPNATLGLKAIDVTDMLGYDLAAGRPHCQFRLRFATLTTDNDGEDDCAYMTDAENSATGRDDVPILEIRLRP